MSDRAISSWKYTRGKYRSALATVEEEYPDLASKNPLLKAAVLQAKLAEAAIEGVMAGLAMTADDDEGDDFN
jgi:hypothetical protein